MTMLLGASCSGCAAALVTVCCASALVAGGAAVALIAPPTEEVVAIEVLDVECAACSRQVQDAIRAVDGVKRIEQGSRPAVLLVTYALAPERPAIYVSALRTAGFANTRAVPR